MTPFGVTTRVESSRVLGCLSGRFHAANEATVLWGYNERLELYRERPISALTLLFKQQIYDILLALAYSRGRVHEQGNGHQPMDSPVLLFASQRIAILHFKPETQRFITLHAVCLRSQGIPALQEHPILCVDPCSGSIALSPDRKALAVFRPDPLGSLSSQLSRATRINLSLPVQRPEMYEYTEQPSITAMVYSGARLYVMTSTEYTPKSTMPPSAKGMSQDGQPATVIHAVIQMLSAKMDMSLKDYAYVSMDLSRSELPILWPDSRDEYEGSSSPGFGDGGVWCLRRAGELARVTPVASEALFDNGVWRIPVRLQMQRFAWTSIHGGPEPQTDHAQYTGPADKDVASLAVGPCAICLATGLHILWSSHGMYRAEMVDGVPKFNKVVPQGTSVGEADLSWLQDPGQLAGLPSGALLAVPRGGDARVLEWGPLESNQPGPCNPRVSQVLRLVPELACAVMTRGSRMCQKQVLGVSMPHPHAGKALPSRLHVLHGARVMERLFESSPDYAGVTGLFPVATTAQEGATTAAVIISFASGSRALTAGNTFSDITEAIGLNAEAQTLAAGTIANGVTAQVTSKSIHLCAVHGLQEAPGADDFMVEGTPRKRVSQSQGEGPLPASAMEHSDAGVGDYSGQGTIEHHSSGRSSCSQSRLSSEAQLRSSALWEGQQMAEEGAAWEPPSKASITCAVVLPGVIIVATAQPHRLTTLTLNQPGSPSVRAAGVGKRKRSDECPRLSALASADVPAEVSCIHAIETQEVDGDPSHLCAAGLHDGAVALFKLLEGSPAGSAWCFQPCCSLHVPPRNFCIPHIDDLAMEDVPGSILLLAGACSRYPFQALVGWRSGKVMQLECRLAAPGSHAAVDETAGRISRMQLSPETAVGDELSDDSECSQAAQVPCAQMKVVRVRRLGSLPAQLTSLSPQGQALCLSEHMAIASFSACSGRLILQPLAGESALHAAPIHDRPDDPTSADGARCCLLTASDDGALRLLRLTGNTPVQSETALLRPDCKLLAINESNRLAVLQESPGRAMQLHCLPLGTVLQAWHESSPGSEQGGSGLDGDMVQTYDFLSASGQPRATPEQDTDPFDSLGRVKGLCLAALVGSDVADPEWHHSYALGAAMECYLQWRVGEPLGRLQIIAFGPGGPKMLGVVRTAGTVSAVAQHWVNYQAQHLLIAAVGSRLAAFGPISGRLDMHDWIQTREALTAVTVCKSGLIAAVGPTQSAIIYTYSTAGFQIVCADPVSRSPVACLPLHKDLAEVEQAILLDQSGTLVATRHCMPERQIERNMRQTACFRARSSPAALCYGSMRFEELGVAESPTVQCMTACFRDGQVLEIGLLSAVELAVLGTAQCALSRDRQTAPLSWVEHDRFRHGCSNSTGPCSRIVDVDFVAQLEHLHEADAERILGSIDRDMVSRHISSNSDLVPDASLLKLCRSLESVLEIVSGQSTLWPANMRPRYPGSQH